MTNEMQRKRTRDYIARKSRFYEDSHDWDEKREIGNFKAGSSKCNLFVFQMLKDTEAEVPFMRGGRPYWRTSPPTAEDWADKAVNIPNWEFVDGPAQPGDIVATLPPKGKTSGHVGIVAGDGETASSNSGIDGKITVNDWGSRKEQKGLIKIRRYTGR